MIKLKALEEKDSKTINERIKNIVNDEVLFKDYYIKSIIESYTELIVRTLMLEYSVLFLTDLENKIFICISVPNYKYTNSSVATVKFILADKCTEISDVLHSVKRYLEETDFKIVKKIRIISNTIFDNLEKDYDLVDGNNKVIFYKV